MIEIQVIPPSPTLPVRGCNVSGCTGAAVLQWQRLATQAELATITLPLGETSAGIAVFGCEQHALSLDAAALVHNADCSWPVPCICPGVAVPS